MNSEDRVELAIGALYDAALSSESWPDALKLIGEIVKAHIVSLEIIHGREGPFGFHHGLTNEQVAQLTRWAEYSPYLNQKGRVPIGKAVLGQTLVSPTELRRSFFYDVLARRNDAFHMCGLAVRNESNRFCGMSAWRSELQEPFDERETKILNRIAPHLSRAVRIASTLEHSKIIAENFESVLAGLAVGVTLLDAQHRILFANPEAERLFNVGPIRVRAGKLIVSGRNASKTLQTFLATVSQSNAGIGARLENDQGVVQLLSVPVSRRASELPQFEPAATVMLIMIDEAMRPIPPIDIIRQIFGLTQAEACLAEALLRGESSLEYAERRQLSMNTIKTQIRSIYNKTGVRRQSDLIRKMMPLVLAGMPDRTPVL